MPTHIQNNCKWHTAVFNTCLHLFFIFFCLCIWSRSSYAEVLGDPAIAREVLEELHVDSDDLQDDRLVSDIKDLAARGTNIIPGILYILDVYDDRMTLSSVLGLVGLMTCDRSILLPSIRKLLDKENKWIRIYAIRSLGVIGTEQDKNNLLDILSDPDEGVRITAAKSLGKIGTAKTADKIQSWIDNKKATMTKEEQIKDTSIKAAEDAVEALRGKISVRQQHGKHLTQPDHTRINKDTGPFSDTSDSGNTTDPGYEAKHLKTNTRTTKKAAQESQPSNGHGLILLVIVLGVGLAISIVGAWLLIYRRKFSRVNKERTENEK